MRYQLIRDKRISELNESEIEVCDNNNECKRFSIKEIMNLFAEVLEEDSPVEDLFIDIFDIMANLMDLYDMNPTDLDKKFKKRRKELGPFSKYLLKIH